MTRWDKPPTPEEIAAVRELVADPVVCFVELTDDEQRAAFAGSVPVLMRERQTACGRPASRATTSMYLKDMVSCAECCERIEELCAARVAGEPDPPSRFLKKRPGS
jgi:hypothetical protein